MKKSTAIRVVAIILGVIVIPLAYSILYLKAFNDPYSKLQSLPIAVVNKDTGAVINGKDRNLGGEMVDELKGDNQLKWVFTDEMDAEQGLKGTKYYAVITIPDSFSQNVSSAEDTTKTPAELQYKANEKRNYLAAQILSRAMLEMQQRLRSSVDKEITLALTDKIKEVPNSLKELDGHLGDLKEGTQKLADGEDEFHANIKRVCSGVGQLNDGINRLDGGINQLYDGMQTFDGKVNELSGGVGKLNDGINQLDGGIVGLYDGINKLDGGLQTFDGKVNELSGGVGKLNTGINQLYTGSAQLSGSLQQYKTGYESMMPQWTKFSGGFTQMHNNIPGLVGGVNTLDQGLSKLFMGTTAFSKGLTQFFTGFDQFTAGQTALNDSVNTNIPLLIGGIQQLNNGANNITLQNPSTKQTYTTNYAAVTSQYVDGVDTMQQSYGQLLAGLKDCAATTDPVAFQQKFTAIMTQLQKNQETMSAQSQQLTAAGQLLKKGSSDLCGGIGALNSNVDKLQTLQKSINQLQAAAVELQKASGALQKGSQELTTGISDAKDGADTLNQGAQQLPTGVDALQSGVDQLTDALTKFQQAANQLSAGADTLNAGVLQEKTGLNQLDGNMPALKEGSAQLKDGSSQLKDGSSQLKDGSAKEKAGLNELNGNMPALKDGVAQTKDGVAQLKDGADQEKAGLNELNGNMPALKDGSSQLNDGAAQLNDGAKELKDGINEKIQDTDKQVAKLDNLDEYTAKPVSLSEEKLEAVPNYGTAFAPYFMSLSLWVGALIMFFGIYLDPDKRMPLLSRTSNRKLVRLAGFFGIGLAQAIALAVLVKLALRLQVNNIGGYFFACILVSMVFISIVQFFIIHLGDAGKLFGILLLILQLTSCGGTFPMETVPSFFNWLYPYMPMTYSVNILKEVISGHSSSIVVQNALILAAIGVVFTVLTVVFSLVKKSHEDNKSKPTPAHA